MPDNDSSRNITPLERFHSIKSIILSQASRIENIIEMILGYYYTNNEMDYKDFSFVLFHDNNELSFDKKIKMVERLLERKFPQYLKNDPDFIKKLHRIRRTRNKFAHSTNPNNAEFEKFHGKPYFELAFFAEGDTKHEQITWKDLESRVNDIFKIADYTQEILFNILDSKTPNENNKT